MISPFVRLNIFESTKIYRQHQSRLSHLIWQRDTLIGDTITEFANTVGRQGPTRVVLVAEKDIVVDAEKLVLPIAEQALHNQAVTCPDVT